MPKNSINAGKCRKMPKIQKMQKNSINAEKFMKNFINAEKCRKIPLMLRNAKMRI
jgi:ribosomal protein L40E